MKRISVLLAVVVLLVGCVSALNAASSIYGMSGLVVTPDDSIAATQTLVPSVNHVLDDDVDFTTYGAAFGIVPNLEVSAVAISVDDDTEAIVNGKYRLMSETATKPALVVGVVDITQNVDDEIAAFVLVSKNLSSAAEGFSGRVSKPIKGTLGFGTGLYDGFFAGLDIAVAPKLSCALEYVANDSVFNGCVRFQPTQALTITAGTLDFDHIYAGVSFGISTF